MVTIQAQLKALADPNYKAFHTNLIPTVDPNTVLGVQIPKLRRLAKQLAGTAQARAFCRTLPHRYYEENNLHGFLIESIKDFDKALAALDVFLPYIDNWATCDSVSPPIFSSQPARLESAIVRWLASEHPYTVRYGIGMLQRYFLGAAFRPCYLQWVAAVRSDEYYVNMMIAWFFATALAKQPTHTLPYFKNRMLPPLPLQKAKQKARESRRIPPDIKKELL